MTSYNLDPSSVFHERESVIHMSKIVAQSFSHMKEAHVVIL